MANLLLAIYLTGLLILIVMFYVGILLICYCAACEICDIVRRIIN
jgi:hypothetical protein